MYRHLASRLDPEMPVYGVFSQTEIDLLYRPDQAAASAVSVEALAQEYVTLIRGIQPHGPYFLGGYSIGGALAYEVAQRLQRSGESIGLVVMLDSMLPGRGLKHLRAGVSRRLRLIRRQGLKHLMYVYRVYKAQVARRHEPGSRRVQIYAQAMAAYDAASCNLPMLFLQAGDDPSTSPAYGWRGLVPGLTMQRVPGNHGDIMDPPNVDVLAPIVLAHVKQAKATRTRPHAVASSSEPTSGFIVCTCNDP